MPYKDKDKKKEADKRWREENKEHHKELKDNWKRENAERVKRVQKAYAQTPAGKATAKRAQNKYAKTEKRKIAVARYHASEKGRRYLLKNSLDRFGITPEDYKRMLAEQKGVCAICNKPDNKRRLSLDHYHETGQIRGLLCANCNHLLGNAQDNEDTLLAAIQYLRKHQQSIVHTFIPIAT